MKISSKNPQNQSDDGNTFSHLEGTFNELYEIVKKLRSDYGCAWDREQTVESLLPHLVEETYELIDAVHKKDFSNVAEELGDLFLLTTMISFIHEEETSYTLHDVFKTINEKLIRRHPHVFGSVQLDDPEHIIKQWNDIKKDIEGRDSSEYVTDSIPKSLPPLERAYRLQRKASQYGFDWSSIEGVIEKTKEELDELQVEMSKERPSSKIEEELGDLLFSVANISRFLGIDPAVALHKTNTKFINRFSFVQDKLREQDLTLSKENMETMEQHWIASKEHFK